jgi:hypothetical protein
VCRHHHVHAGARRADLVDGDITAQFKAGKDLAEQE